jgi:hypothetical protein
MNCVVKHFGVPVRFHGLGSGAGLIFRLVRGRTKVYGINIFTLFWWATAGDGNDAVALVFGSL